MRGVGIQIGVMMAIIVAGIGFVFPQQFWLAVARIVARLRVRWRRYLVNKYGGRAADRLFCQAKCQYARRWGEDTDLTAAYQRCRTQLVEHLGQQIVDQQWGPPTWLERLFGR